MDIAEVRKINFQKLCDKYGRKIVSQKLKYPDETYINLLYKGHNNIGPQTEKKIRKAFNLPPLWLDTLNHEDGDAPVPTGIRDGISRRLASMDEAKIQEVLDYMDFLDQKEIRRNQKEID